MGKFTKTKNIKGVYKNIIINDGQFMDEETGEILDVIGQLRDVYGENAFDITTTLKIDEEL